MKIHEKSRVRNRIKYPSASKGIRAFVESDKDDDDDNVVEDDDDDDDVVDDDDDDDDDVVDDDDDDDSTSKKAVNIYLPMSSQIGVDPRIKVKRINLA